MRQIYSLSENHRADRLAAIHDDRRIRRRGRSQAYEQSVAESTEPGVTAKDGRVLARGQLSLRRPDLPVRQSVAETAAQARAHQAAVAWSLGYDPWSEPHICSSQPAHQGTGPERHLYHWPGTRREIGR